MKAIEKIKMAIDPLRQSLLKHPVYDEIKTVDDLNLFMESHVFAVWDFMSLLKALQIELTCVKIPWTPRGTPAIRKLVNEIVLAEETDVDMQGNPASHFELYLQAMQSTKANTLPIEQLINSLKAGNSLASSYVRLDIDKDIRAFLEFTFSVIGSGEPHKIAAAFTFGREDLIPDMFTSLVKDLNRKVATDLSMFIYYLERHIELDGDEHGPMALRMVSELCGNDLQKWEDCVHVARRSLEARLILWDNIYQKIQGRQMHTS